MLRLVLIASLTQGRSPDFESRAASAARLRTIGVAALVGTGVSREVRGVFATMERWAEAQALRGDPQAPELLAQARTGQLIGWILTASFAVVSLTLLLLGFALEPTEPR